MRIHQGISARFSKIGFGLAWLICATAWAEDVPIVLVTNFDSNTVSVIEISSNTVFRTIPVGLQPRSVEITPDGSRAYVINFVAPNVQSSFSVIAMSTLTVVNTFGVGTSSFGTRPFEMAITPDGTRIYASREFPSDVVVIDTATNTVIDTFLDGGRPRGVAITPDGTRAYVVGSNTDSVSVVDTATNVTIQSVAVGDLPFHAAVTPDGTRVYVANALSNFVSIIDVATSAVTGTVPTIGGTFWVAITPDGTRAYVPHGTASNSVSVIDTSSNTIVDNITVGSVPLKIAITPDGTRAYVTDSESDSVSVIDLSTNMVVATVPVGDRPVHPAIGITPSDDDAPVTSNITGIPNPVAVSSNVDLTANVDDTNTGGSNVASAEYSLDGVVGPWIPMVATDSTFDEVSEEVGVSFNAPAEAGIYDLCVRGTDDPGNVGSPECIMLVVYDPSGGFITGSGWIDSAAGAYIMDSSLAGKASFGFVSKYKKGATIPDGNTEFQFKAGNLNFHGSSYEFLVITMGSTNAQFKGSGTINSGLAPNGTEFRFMIWARDDSPDTLRIRIWYEDGG